MNIYHRSLVAARSPFAAVLRKLKWSEWQREWRRVRWQGQLIFLENRLATEAAAANAFCGQPTPTAAALF